MKHNTRITSMTHEWSSAANKCITLMAQCKTVVTPLLRHWSYHSLALSHWYVLVFSSTNVIMDREIALACNWLFWGQCIFVINTLRTTQNGCHFPDNIFKCIFLNENISISNKISMNFVPKGPINNIPALVQIMAWRRPGDKPLSEPMMVSLLTHICVTRPQWVNDRSKGSTGVEIKIFQCGSHGTIYPASTIPWLLMALWRINDHRFDPVVTEYSGFSAGCLKGAYSNSLSGFALGFCDFEVPRMWSSEKLARNYLNTT